MHIDHINIAAPMELLERVRDFYCSVLDLREGFRPNFSQRGFWLYADDKPIIHLSESNRRQDNEQQGHVDHVAFQTTGVDALIGRLTAKNIEYRSDYIPELNMTQLFFKDPAGTGLEVNCLGESSAARI
jgi:catechol-2,3-dioxygenase